MSRPLNLFVDRGSDYQKSVPLKQANGNPVDLTGYTLIAQMRKRYDDATSYNLTVTADGNPALGIINIAMSAAVTGTVPAGRWVYDVLAVNETTGAQSRLLEGVVDVTPNVTVPPQP